jgi:hypothetical protein
MLWARTGSDLNVGPRDSRHPLARCAIEALVVCHNIEMPKGLGAQRLCGTVHGR